MCKVQLSDSFAQFQGKEAQHKAVLDAVHHPLTGKEAFCVASACIPPAPLSEAQGCTRERLNETRGRMISDELAARKGCPHKQPPEANALNSQNPPPLFLSASESNAALILPLERPGSSVPL